MARSTNIDDIGFRNLKKNADSILCKHDDTKMDKSGEKCSNKNLHCNPTNPHTRLFLSLGSHVSMNSDALGRKDFYLQI